MISSVPDACSRCTAPLGSSGGRSRERRRRATPRPGTRLSRRRPPRLRFCAGGGLPRREGSTAMCARIIPVSSRAPASAPTARIAAIGVAGAGLAALLVGWRLGGRGHRPAVGAYSRLPSVVLARRSRRALWAARDRYRPRRPRALALVPACPSRPPGALPGRGAHSRSSPRWASVARSQPALHRQRVSTTPSAPSTAGYWSSCLKCARHGDATPKRQRRLPATATLIRRLKRQPQAPKTESFAVPNFRDGYKTGPAAPDL